ncbi:MAG: PASTA domain-containing protein [Ignavibacteriae bacterium]|nr:PASTA domain-containing protein [Ignavibacteriota bacterium]
MSRGFQYGVGIFVAVFILMNYAVLPWYVYHGGTLSVPEVTGRTAEDAENILATAGLVGILSDTVLDNSLPAGSVVTQNPKANAIVKYGRHVYLTVCGGEVQVNVPQLRGRSLREAKFALERNGLELGEVEYAASDSSPVNTVISQTVMPIQKVKKGTVVGLTVSSGALSSSTEVPDLTGKSLADAEKVLARTGLRVGIVTEQVNNDLLPNTVVDQFPKPGSSVEPGKSIDLFIVKVGKVLDER